MGINTPLYSFPNFLYFVPIYVSISAISTYYISLLVKLSLAFWDVA